MHCYKNTENPKLDVFKACDLEKDKKEQSGRIDKRGKLQKSRRFFAIKKCKNEGVFSGFTIHLTRERMKKK